MNLVQTPLADTSRARLGAVSLIATLALGLFAMLAAPASASDTSTVLAEGTWTKKAQKIAGSWQIVERDGSRLLILDESFSTRKAPDLKIVLSPLAIDRVASKTALEGSRIVAPLPEHKGRQEIRLPDDADLSEFKSVLIHCERYTKLWGGAELP